MQHILNILDHISCFIACGFFLATPTAIIFEMIVSTIQTIFDVFIALFVLASDAELSSELSSDPKTAGKNFVENYPGIFVFFQFINAFIVAALVEEMVKYFSYRMVVTPDLIQRCRTVASSSNTNTEEAEQVDASIKSAKSTGAGITVAVSPDCATENIYLLCGSS
jgi:hypothetical protein